MVQGRVTLDFASPQQLVMALEAKSGFSRQRAYEAAASVLRMLGRAQADGKHLCGAIVMQDCVANTLDSYPLPVWSEEWAAWVADYENFIEKEDAFLRIIEQSRKFAPVLDDETAIRIGFFAMLTSRKLSNEVSVAASLAFVKRWPELLEFWRDPWAGTKVIVFRLTEDRAANRVRLSSRAMLGVLETGTVN